tara:strand:+ start:1564 stop:1848 length:285 start_codon:yes stop_codon:yes gene_type:complete
MSKKTKKVKVSLSEHYWVVENKDHDPVPLDCPVCELLLSDKKDVISYKQNKCCKSCSDVFFYPNKEKWKKGWRPSLDEINNQREKRQSVPTYIL